IGVEIGVLCRMPSGEPQYRYRKEQGSGHRRRQAAGDQPIQLEELAGRVEWNLQSRNSQQKTVRGNARKRLNQFLKQRMTEQHGIVRAAKLIPVIDERLGPIAG